MAYISRTGPHVPNVGNFDTLAALQAKFPAATKDPGTTAYTTDTGFVISDGTTWAALVTGGTAGSAGVAKTGAATYAAARLLVGTATGDTLYVFGRTAQSDGGQGLFTWVAGGSTTINDGYPLSATGGIWRRVEGAIRVEMFGALGDAVTDDAAAINNAIQAAIIYGVPCYLTPGKTYSIASPLICGYFSGGAWDFNTLYFGTPIVPSTFIGAHIQAALIVPTFNDRPALCVQNARNHYYYGFQVNGLNDVSAISDAAKMTNSSWVVASCRDSRYSPYAGIAIDPFGTSTPADGGYPGMSAYYHSSVRASSACVFNMVTCARFVVGFIMVPNGQTQGAEDFSFYDCEALYNKVGFAICQSQSRNVRVTGIGINRALYCFDGALYGQQQGFTPKIAGANLAGKFLFHVPTSYGEPCSLNDLHCESFASIGYFGQSATSQQPVTFRNCNFTFGDSLGGLSPDYHLYTLSRLKFDTCQFVNNVAGVLRMKHFRGIKFDNCEFAVQNNELMLAPDSGDWPAQFAQMSFDGCYTQDTRKSVISDNQIQTTEAYTNIDGALIPLGGLVRFTDPAASSSLYFNGSTYNDAIISLGSVTVTVGTGTATFTAPDVTIVKLGDLIYTQTTKSLEAFDGTISELDDNYCLGNVSNIAGSVVTISGLPQSIVTGTFSLYTQSFLRFHQSSVGDIANASATISNVTNPGSWIAGNRIRGAGIPAGAYVVTAGATMTISKAATATATGQRLFDANMKVLPAGPLGGTGGVPFAAGLTGATPVPNCLNGLTQSWTLSANSTWGAPLNVPKVGQILTLFVTANGTWTTAWNAIYRNAPAWAASTNAFKATANFMYDGTSWQFIGGSTAFA